MENNNKQSSKLRSKILKILPKAAAAVTVAFQNPPFSPGRDRNKVRSENAASAASRLKTHGNKGFSGPIMIPDEARRKPKDGGIETQEPTSPKVSCIGQIKHKKKQIKKKKAEAMSLPPHTVSSTSPKDATEVKKKQASKKFQRMFFHTGKPKIGVRKSSASSSSSYVGEGNSNGGVSDNAPPIGHMRRFASGRETFSNFDWRAQIAPEEMNHRDCYSEDDRAGSDVEEEEEDDEEEEEEREIIIPFSAPILAGGRGCGGGGSSRGGSVANLQPRKEINLWKRRTMAPPRPLQVNPVLTAK